MPNFALRRSRALGGGRLADGARSSSEGDQRMPRAPKPAPRDGSSVDVRSSTSREAASSTSPEAANENRSALAALARALNAIALPAFVLDPCGRILSRNVSAETFLAPNPKSVESSLAAAVTGGQNGLEWDLIPLRGEARSVGFLAVRVSVSQTSALADGVRKAIGQWKLTSRQGQVLELLAQGFTNAEIAEALGIRETTVEFHVAGIFDKAGVENRTTLIARLMGPRNGRADV
jgi:DNA-binding CsgD family transcriptional regulator